MFGRPIEVSAQLGNQMHQMEVEDMVSANMTFAGGAQGSFQFSINQPKGCNIRYIAGDRGVLNMPDVQSLTSDVQEDILLGRFPGTLSQLRNELKNIVGQPSCKWKKVQKKPVPWLAPPLSFSRRALGRLGILPRVQNGIEILLQSFAEAILEDKEPLVSGESAKDAIEVINAIMLSGIEGRTVSLPVDREEIDELYRRLVGEEIRIPSWKDA
jgi:predicted dehydrogenase